MKPLKTFPLVFLLFATSSIAQKAPPSAPESGSVSTLEFAKPTKVDDMDARAMLAGRFDCGSDGSIYTFVDGYVPNAPVAPQRLALVGIHPNGSVTHFSWRSVLGFQHVSLPKSTFSGNDHLYVLVDGIVDGARGRPSNYPLVLAFNKQGALSHATVLHTDIRPLAMGVFQTGNILIAAEDRLNHRMALHLFATDGTPIRQIPLGQDDLLTQAAQLPSVGHGAGTYSATLLISMLKIVPVGSHLLLVPLETSGLPVVEISEFQAVHSAIPHLPAQTVLEGLVAASSSTWTMRLATFVEGDTEAFDQQGKVLGVATRPLPQIAEFSAQDGVMLRRISIGSEGVYPACESQGAFLLLSSGMSPQGLQVVTATER